MPSIINELLLLLIWLLIAVVFTLSTFGTFFIFAVDVWIKKKSRGATIVVLFDSNREESYELVKLGGEESFILEVDDGSGEKDETRYVIDPSKQMARYWPPALPTFLQVKMAAYYYMTANPTPIDPLQQLNLRLLSPRMLARLTSEKILTGLIREARESIGMDRNKSILPYVTIGLVSILIMLVVINILIANGGAGDISALQDIITQTG